MSFWNNPENNSLKTIIIVVVIAVLGYFVYTYMQKDSLSGEGRVINIVNPANVNVMSNPTQNPNPQRQSCKVETKRSDGGQCIRVNADCSISPATGCSEPTPSTTL